MDPYLDFIHKFNSATSLDELSNILKSYAKALGFEYIAFGATAMSSKQLLVNIHPKYPFISTFPKEWIARYIDKNYIAIDPLATTAINNINPFTCALSLSSLYMFFILFALCISIFDSGNKFG